MIKCEMTMTIHNRENKTEQNDFLKLHNNYYMIWKQILY